MYVWSVLFPFSRVLIAELLWSLYSFGIAPFPHPQSHIAVPILAGNKVVLKPFEVSLKVRSLIVDLFVREAGLPAGVLNMISLSIKIVTGSEMRKSLRILQSATLAQDFQSYNCQQFDASCQFTGSDRIIATEVAKNTSNPATCRSLEAKLWLF